MANRKRKKKHLKLAAIGGNSTVHLGTKRVTVTVSIPRDHLSGRLR